MNETIQTVGQLPVSVVALALVFGFVWWVYINTIDPSNFEFCKVCATPKRKICGCPTCGYYENPEK